MAPGCNDSSFHRSGFWLLLLLLAMALAPAAAAPAQELDPIKAAKVKAAYVFNFMKFADWPPSSFAEKESPIVLAIVGSDDTARYLEALVRDRSIQSRPIAVRRLQPPVQGDLTEAEYARRQEQFLAELRRCHVAYVAASAQSALTWILRDIAAAPVLTVSDSPGFARTGGMLGLVHSDGRIVFEANVEAVKKGGMELSSKLLRLAQVVGEGDGS